MTPSVGIVAGTLGATAGTGFTNDYFGNANDAAFFTNTAAQLSIANGNDVIANSGKSSVNAALVRCPCLYLTRRTPMANVTTRYIFSDGDANPEFYLKLLNTNELIMGAGSKALTNSTTLNIGTWYYFAATWNPLQDQGLQHPCESIITLGVAGQATNTLTAGFTERGGSGGISATAFLGNGGTFTLSGTQADGGAFQVGGVPGLVDELATGAIK